MKITRPILLIILAMANLIPGFAQSIRDSVVVTMETEMGNIRIVLFTKKAPATCANFLKYIEQLGDLGGEFYRAVTMANQPDKKVKIEVIQGGFNLKNVDTSR